jgi:hypothetical protein
LEDKKPRTEGDKPTKRHQRNKKHSISSQYDQKDLPKPKKQLDAKKAADTTNAPEGLEAGSVGVQKCKLFV